MGSRHLQGLSLMKKAIAIYVVDKAEQALSVAKERFEQVSLDFKGRVTYCKGISEIPVEINLAIIATNSNIRFDIILELLEHAKVDNLLLEKFLFPAPNQYSYATELFEENKVKVWVNCPRRVWNFYRELQRTLTEPIHISVTGSQWGMASNSIHFLDLFSYLNGSGEICLSSERLDPSLFESKRKGFMEISGCVHFKHMNGSVLELNCLADGDQPSVITINSATGNAVIHELAGEPSYAFVSRNADQVQKVFFDVPFQSRLTNMIAEDIINGRDCGLISYQESAELHLLFLKMLASFYKRIGNAQETYFIT